MPMKEDTSLEKLNDIGFRLILIPFFGIAVPLITKMNGEIVLTHWQTKFSFAYTIAIAFLVWQGNRYLLFSLRSYFNWFNKPVRKILALLLAVSFYTIPISSLMLIGWYYIFLQGHVNWNTVFMSTLIIMVCVIFITHVYETVFLVKESESEMVRNEQLEKAKAQAELEALKNQIDPHFIFNSLNTLSHLIEDSPVKARLFNDNMAEVFRYILRNKGRELVLLQEEIEFLKDYFSLLKIRFDEAIQLNVSVPEQLIDQYLIPPISLQILIENATKHNEFSTDIPLVIDIGFRPDELVINNETRRKNTRRPSSGIGLQNLDERYRLITQKSIGIQHSEKKFTVIIPILKIT
ncbi:MAG TPA: histidine kinase [Puia sp.]|nr:histidine kinase [Puia sp.]